MSKFVFFLLIIVLRSNVARFIVPCKCQDYRVKEDCPIGNCKWNGEDQCVETNVQSKCKSRSQSQCHNYLGCFIEESTGNCSSIDFQEILDTNSDYECCNYPESSEICIGPCIWTEKDYCENNNCMAETKDDCITQGFGSYCMWNENKCQRCGDYLYTQQIQQMFITIFAVLFTSLI